jgi:hypothetical protein
MKQPKWNTTVLADQWTRIQFSLLLTFCPQRAQWSAHYRCLLRRLLVDFVCTAARPAVPLAHLVPPTVSVRHPYRVLIVTNGAVHNGLAVLRDAWRKAVATRTQFKPVHHLFGAELRQFLNQRAITHDASPSARLHSCARAFAADWTP